MGTPDLAQAVRDVLMGRCERIGVPGKWKVWRGADGRVRMEIKE